MISIRESVNDFERCAQMRDLALECYLAAIKTAAQYAVELDDAITRPHRDYLGALAGEVAAADAAVLSESRATFRGLLRDYRDRASQYLNGLRDELAGTAKSLQEIMDALAQTDGDQEARLKSALQRLREASASAPEGELRDTVVCATDTIENGLEQMHKQHQLTIAEFMTEIRLLHQRIDSLETAASVDDLTKLWNRREMEERILAASPGRFCLLLIRVSGFKPASIDFSPTVGEELAAAFTRRLRNSLPVDSIIGRWSDEQFVAIVSLPKAEAVTSAKWIADHLSGSYSCLLNGKTVRPSLKITVGVVDGAADPPSQILERVRTLLSDSANP